MNRPFLGIGVAALGGALLLAADPDLRATITGRLSSERSAARPPSEAEARRALDERVRALAADPRRETYCAGNGFCPRHWDRAGGAAAVPKQPPHVLTTWTGRDVRVLVLCGRDGLGRPYRSDFPVRNAGAGRLEALLIVFWADTEYSGYKPDGEPVLVTLDASESRSPVPNPSECG